ncbi:carboxypeptidase-like regulatory domain-containing protein [Pedobacter sp. SD-b]|uniref:Carboxypeptidase-like regulatory domain-containing protein n=1 Tax=Pedobacter segetis TaxID=2793069 RepID=A0ABS1BEQ6_9SPHI|nr:carboxypeptidase-like regulatory domain-containing protein [Pedobacter segetis]MBK0381345.1 carboxypeptidase-like regulatory domain-containing protein [Pedobacter segetis]
MKKILTILLIAIGFAAHSQTEKPLVQFSGVVYDLDSNSIVPYVSIKNVSNHNNSFASNYKGYFSFVLQEGDTVVFSSIGYKNLELVIPSNLKEHKYTAIIRLKSDNIQLPMVRVFPWASYDEFKKDFLTMKFADDDLEIARKNLSKKSLRELSENIPRDGEEHNAMSFNNLHQALGNKNMVQTNPLLNPFAWGALIKQITEGNKKRSQE